MKCFLNLVLSFFLCFIVTDIVAQSFEYNLYHHQYSENILEFVGEVNSDENTFDESHAKVIVFENIPNVQRIQRLRKEGLQLLDYIGSAVYIASIKNDFDRTVLLQAEVNAVFDLPSEWKIRPALWDQLLMTDDKMDVMVQYFKSYDQRSVLEAFAEWGRLSNIQGNGINNMLQVSLDPKDVKELLSLPFVQYIDFTPGESIPDDTPGRSLHRANMVDSYYPGGMHYTGEGVNVLTRDDGVIGPHIDFHGRLDQSFCGPSRGTHGDGVSGIFAGAGNVDPRNRGMASGAFLHVLDYDASFLDRTMELHFNEDVLITNSSYSNGCNSGYTATTMTVDKQSFDNPTLMHVFSAGNSNGVLSNSHGSNCDGGQWYNITGGHKQGKNVIATANLHSDGLIVESSSRGPAHDGRIKPDIAAHGEGHVSTDPNNTYSPFGGTSGAAPGIAGIAAVLQEVYQTKNNERAPAALLKAVMLNTANDLGNVGPDFIYGWGHVNAFKAAQLIEDGRYEFRSINSGEQDELMINVPNNVKELKIMIYWADQPAALGTTKSLISNIDCSVTDQQGQTHLPWVLDHTPDPDILNLPATKGTDVRNNVEQISILNPEQGDYNLSVLGAEIPFGNQEYYVVTEYVYNDITVVYPLGGESLTPGDFERIHWDTGTDDDEEFLIELSLDGMTWETIATPPANSRMYDWLVPNELTGDAKIRVSRSGISDESDAIFNICQRPDSLRIQRVCLEYIELNWNGVDNAEGYELYVLGDRYMEFLTTVQDTFYQLPNDLNKSEDTWIAISAIYPNGAKSIRTNAVRVEAQKFLNCFEENDMENINLIDDWSEAITSCSGSYLDSVKIHVQNKGSIDQSDLIVAYQFNSDPIMYDTIFGLIEIGFDTIYTFKEPIEVTNNVIGELKTWTQVLDDQVYFNDTLTKKISIYVDNGFTPEIFEDFDSSGEFPSFTSIENSDNLSEWTLVNVRGIDEDYTNCMSFTNFFAPLNQEDVFNFYPLDLTDAPSNAYLLFDLAYSTGEERIDELRIEVSTDCGENFTDTIYQKSGLVLQTFKTNNYFRPSSSDHWRTEGVSLENYVGQENVIIRFINRSTRGNNLYIDNINIKAYTPALPIASFNIESDVICKNEPVKITSLAQGEFLDYQWDFGENGIVSSTVGPGPHEPLYFTEGIKTITMDVTNSAGMDSHTDQLEVIFFPENGFSSTSLGNLMVSFTANQTDGPGVTYSWDFGDGNFSSEANPIHTYTNEQSYDVTLTVQNMCTSLTDTESVMASTVNTKDLDDNSHFTIIPHPNNGSFALEWEGVDLAGAELKIFSSDGRVVYRNRTDEYLNTQRYPIQLEDVPSGLYYLNIQNAEINKTIKLLIE